MWYLLPPRHTGTTIITAAAAAAQTVIADAAAAAAATQIPEASLWIKTTTRHREAIRGCRPPQFIVNKDH